MPPICLKAFSSAALGSSLFSPDRDFLIEGVHDQEPRYIVHRLLGLALWRLLSLPQVVSEEQVRLELLKWTVGDPGVELSRALFEVVVLDAQFLDVVHSHAPTMQPRSSERWF